MGNHVSTMYFNPNTGLAEPVKIKMIECNEGDPVETDAIKALKRHSVMKMKYQRADKPHLKPPDELTFMVDKSKMYMSVIVIRIDKSLYKPRLCLFLTSQGDPADMPMPGSDDMLPDISKFPEDVEARVLEFDVKKCLISNSANSIKLGRIVVPEKYGQNVPSGTLQTGYIYMTDGSNLVHYYCVFRRGFYVPSELNSQSKLPNMGSLKAPGKSGISNRFSKTSNNVDTNALNAKVSSFDSLNSPRSDLSKTASTGSISETPVPVTSKDTLKWVLVMLCFILLLVILRN